MPHVTLLQRFVRAKDFDAVTAAITKVLVAEQPTEMKLTTKSLDYVMFARVGRGCPRRRTRAGAGAAASQDHRCGCTVFSKRRDRSGFRWRSGHCGNG